MWDNRNRILNWVQQGAIKQTDVNQAIAEGQGQPTKMQWLGFLQLAMLWLAVIALCSGAIFFFAYNWQDMSRFSKFALVEAAILLSCIGYVRLSFHPQMKTAMLMALSLCIGALLAVVGQTYQTGADPWQLFAVWSVLMLPLALIGRSCILWIFWIAIINAALGLYLDLSRHFLWLYLRSADQALLFALLNTLLLVIFEAANYSHKLPSSLTFFNIKSPYLANRYTQQLLVTAAGFAISMWASHGAFRHSNDDHQLLYYTLWIALAFSLYRYVIKDLYVIAASFLSFIIVSSMYIFDALEADADEAILLLISLYFLGSSSLATYWLKKLSVQLYGTNTPQAIIATAVTKDDILDKSQPEDSK